MSFHPPRLGPGAIYLRSIDALFRSHPDLIHVAEVEPQTLWTRPTSSGAPPRSSPVELRHIAALPQHKLAHGVGYPIGGTLCDQQHHVPEFRAWIDSLATPWTSEHLSILEIPAASASLPCGFLMPPLQTEAAVSLAGQNIRSRALALGRPFAFETGVNYFAPRPGEMSDGEFFASIAVAADCGILLDLTNLWVNHRNGRAPIDRVLAALPLDRVWEVHLAGVEFARGFWLDAHSCEIDPDLARFAAEVVASLPNLGTIIFEIAPDRAAPFGAKAFLREMELLNSLWERVTCLPAPPTAQPSASPSPCTSPSTSPSPSPASLPGPHAWEHVLAEHMLPPPHRPSQPLPPAEAIALTAEDHRSFALYRSLSASFRAGTIAELLENTIRLLLLALGAQPLRDLVTLYVVSTPPHIYPSDEALAFRGFLAHHSLDIPGLEEILAFESTLVEAAADSTTLQLTLNRDIDAILTAIDAGHLPNPSSKMAPFTLEISVDPTPTIRILETSPA